jgi:hypothetical protein
VYYELWLANAALLGNENGAEDSCEGLRKVERWLPPCCVQCHERGPLRTVAFEGRVVLACCTVSAALMASRY